MKPGEELAIRGTEKLTKKKEDPGRKVDGTPEATQTTARPSANPRQTEWP